VPWERHVVLDHVVVAVVLLDALDLLARTKMTSSMWAG
jgi:hypothetical protein